MIKLRFRNSRDSSIQPMEVSIKLDQHPAVDLWLDRFKYELKSKAFLKKEHLFMGESVLTVEEMIDKINSTLDTISKYDFVENSNKHFSVSKNPDISERLSLEDFKHGPNNKKMNTIHNYFPILSGPAHNTSNYMYIATPEVRAAICRLNLEVHELHTVLQQTGDGRIHVNVSWHRAPKNLEKLPSVFDELFRTDVKFGDVLLGYPQIGKTHFEAFVEEDEELDDEHVEPIKLLSGDCLLRLSPDMGQGTINDFNNWIINQGLDINDKSLRLGFAKLGSVVDIDHDFVKQHIQGKFDDVDKITLIEDGIEDSYYYSYGRFDKDYEDLVLQHIND